ncbi:MAG: FkbM family methyltransferase [Flavobacteriaceae bacterium]|nr:FkbM family methyltransferase [Flavobacteriaceae bacterium]
MIKWYNILCLFFLKLINRIGRGYYLRKRLLNCESILQKNFKEQSKFSFIQVGANDGVSFDFLYDFVISRDSSGIVIEPIREYFDDLVLNYKKFPKIIKINKAVHKNKTSITFYKIDPTKANKYPEWVKGLASLDKNHHLKTGIDTNDICNEEVQADNLMEIINNYYKNKKIDFFQIDTEGYDFEVLKMVNFDKLRPKIIKYENVNLKNKEAKELQLLLKDEKYFLFEEKGDTIAVDLKRIRLI